jgi:hypothetical protein
MSRIDPWEDHGFVRLHESDGKGPHPTIPPQVDRSLPILPETARRYRLGTQYQMQKNTRLESSRRTVPPKWRLRLRQVLGKRRQDSHCTQGPLKSGKQTPLPTFQQPLLRKCYKSSNQFSLHLEFVPAHPSFVTDRDLTNGPSLSPGGLALPSHTLDSGNLSRV